VEVFLNKLYETIENRKNSSTDISYTASLFAKGRGKIAEKVVEEATETIIAYLEKDKAQVIYESADLLFHLMILLSDMEVSLEDIKNELERRENRSGIEEKNSRT